jgi:hypothetical protein
MTPETSLIVANPVLSACCQSDSIYNARHEVELFLISCPEMRVSIAVPSVSQLHTPTHSAIILIK